MIGILLALCVSFLKALGELVGKKSTDEKHTNSIDEYTLVFGSRVLSSILFLPLLLVIEIPVITWNLFFVFLFSIIGNAIANITSLKAVKYGELSIVGPLTAFTLPFLLFSAYFIAGESTNIYGYIGVLLIFFGTYFLGVQSHNKGFLHPLKHIYSNAGAKYMLITALIWSITGPLDKLGVTAGGVIFWMFLSNIGVCVLLGLYIQFFRKKTQFSDLTQKGAIHRILAVTLVGGSLVFMQMLALKYTLVIYVIAIKRASGIFSIILGALFYKEKNIAWKLLAAVIMLAGVATITLLGNI